MKKGFRPITVISSSSTLVKEETDIPAKIFHYGISLVELRGIKGCV